MHQNREIEGNGTFHFGGATPERTKKPVVLNFERHTVELDVIEQVEGGRILGGYRVIDKSTAILISKGSCNDERSRKLLQDLFNLNAGDGKGLARVLAALDSQSANEPSEPTSAHFSLEQNSLTAKKFSNSCSYGQCRVEFTWEKPYSAMSVEFIHDSLARTCKLAIPFDGEFSQAFVSVKARVDELMTGSPDTRRPELENLIEQSKVVYKVCSNKVENEYLLAVAAKVIKDYRWDYTFGESNHPVEYIESIINGREFLVISIPGVNPYDVSKIKLTYEAPSEELLIKVVDGFDQRSISGRMTISAILPYSIGPLDGLLDIFANEEGEFASALSWMQSECESVVEQQTLSGECTAALPRSAKLRELFDVLNETFFLKQIDLKESRTIDQASGKTSIFASHVIDDWRVAFVFSDDRELEAVEVWDKWRKLRSYRMTTPEMDLKTLIIGIDANSELLEDLLTYLEERFGAK